MDYIHPGILYIFYCIQSEIKMTFCCSNDSLHAYFLYYIVICCDGVQYFVFHSMITYVTHKNVDIEFSTHDAFPGQPSSGTLIIIILEIQII